MRSKVSSGYLPSLDGWRAVAILGVVMVHDQPWVIAGHSNGTWQPYGGWGVELFFAISGVLICWRILEDEASRGAFRLKDFYIRRFFRIQPAAWSYLAVLSLLMLFGMIHEWWHFWLGGMFFYQNYLFRLTNLTYVYGGYFTGHFWTLSLEEHFYLLLSVFFACVKSYRTVVLGMLCVLLLAAQHIGLAHGLYSPDTSTRQTQWMIQWLLLPSLGALLLRQKRVMALAIKYLRPWLVLLTLFAVMYLHGSVRLHRHDVFTPEWLKAEMNKLPEMFVFFVIATMLHPRSWATRFLELAPLRYIGRLSYSIYVWHLLFFCTAHPEAHITWRPLLVVGQRPWCYVGIVLTAMCSYHLIEKPLIRLGHRLAPPSTPGHRDLDVGEKEETSAISVHTPAVAGAPRANGVLAR